MKMFYNVVNSIICCAKEARASIVLKWVHFVLQNCENFKLHSVRGLYDKKQRLIVLCTSDVMYKKYKRLLYTLLDLLARFCKVNLWKAKFGRADWAGGGEKAEVPTDGAGRWNWIFHSPSNFWNQRWDGSRLQLLSQTPNREALRKEWRTSTCYHYLD